MIKLNAVRFAYADAGACLHDIRLHALPGECIVLTGRSGSGKTTITRIINGLAPAYYDGKLEGEVLLGGRDSYHIPQWEKGKIVGSVFQDPASQFFSGELVGELAFACENYGYPADAIRKKVNETIVHMGLSDLPNQSLDTLSSGEKQKVAIASVRAASPLVYVFDEPSANLDEDTSFQLGKIMLQLKCEGHTLIISEHRLSYLMDIADRFVYVESGLLVKCYVPKELAALDETQRHALGLRSPSRVIRPSFAPPDVDEPILELRNIVYSVAGKKIVDSVSLKADSGQCIAITGRNGVGKTTLSQIICGYRRENHGE